MHLNQGIHGVPRLRIPEEFLRSGALNEELCDLDGPQNTRLAGIVRDVVRSELSRSRSAQAEDVEDVCSDAMVSLLARIQAFQKDPAAAREIDNFDGYVAVIAQRACSAWSRRRYPGFHRLRSGLRYLLQSDKRFALWQNSGDQWICGWTRWERGAIEVRSIGSGTADDLATTGTPTQVLERVFAHTQHPVHFDELAKLCARFWAIDDTPQQLEAVETVPEPSAPLDVTLHREARLKNVWQEILELPDRQRMALLLNMHGPDGECGTSLLILTGVTSPRQVAAAIGIPAEEFADLLARLPLTDAEIAQRMQITRQQVINLRKCARERLRRRMSDE